MNLNRILFIMTCLLISLSNAKSYSQSFNCSGLSASRYYLKDTILVACDTVFLLNKVTYSFYRNQLKRINTTDPRLKELVSTQSELIKLYEKRIADMTIEYDTLRKTFQRNLSSSKNFIESSNSELTEIDNSLGKAQINIMAAKDSIASVKILLKEEMVKIRKEKWAWGIGGAVLGGLITILLK
jgi:hypothetical protein